MGRSNAVEFEAGLLEERAVLGLGALLAFGQGEHADVEYFAGVKGVTFGPDHLDDEQPAAGDMARWQLARMMGHWSSLQSWMLQSHWQRVMRKEP
jgi:hypothetical protein